jgi:AraC-like DNA-binding protein
VLAAVDHHPPGAAVHDAGVARRFTELVAAVARQVGYGSGFALSAAFKRVRGVSPQEH